MDSLGRVDGRRWYGESPEVATDALVKGLYPAESVSTLQQEYAFRALKGLDTMNHGPPLMTSPSDRVSAIENAG